MKKMLKTWTKAALLAVMATFLLAGFPACSDGSDDDPKPVMHTVTFVSDGSPVAQQPVEHGKTATEQTAPTKDGYTFSGWYFGGTAFDFNTPIIDNITLTARWGKVYRTEDGAKLTIYDDDSFEYTDADGNSSKGTYETADDRTITGTFTDGPLADSKFEATTTADGSISATVNGEEFVFSPEDDDPGSDGQTPTPTPGDEDDDDTTIPVTSVSLNQKTATVTVGKTTTLVATVSPDNANNKAVTWESDDEEVATVDENGKVTGINKGKAKITVTTEDGNHTDDCEVTVNVRPTSDYLTIKETTDGWEVTGYLSSKFPNDGKVEIPEGVTTIGNSAFSRCTALTSVEIPDSVTTIGNSAFSGCEALTSVKIPASVTTIGSYAFSGCEALTSVKIPASVTTIGSYAFSNTNLATVEIPDSVTTIDECAFYGCTKLASVTIGAGVTTIGFSVFTNCWALTSVKIPDSVTTIGDNAFSRCQALTSVEIPNSVTTIGDNAFYHCIMLESVEISDSVTTIGDKAFYECTRLENVTIGAGVTTIGSYAFASGYALTSVEIPDSVTKIGNSAFSGCYMLTDVIFEDTGGWYVTEQNNYTGGQPADVTDSTTNATNLKATTDLWGKSYLYKK